MNQLKRWIPVFAWALLIFMASTDTFSEGNTSRVILPFLHLLLPQANSPTLEWLQFLIRKCAHFTEYFIFGFLLLRAVRGEHNGWKLRWALLALVIAAGYSALDEFHQSFVPSRTASPWDSLLDTFGAAAAQVVMWAIARWHLASPPRYATVAPKVHEPANK